MLEDIITNKCVIKNFFQILQKKIPVFLNGKPSYCPTSLYGVMFDPLEDGLKLLDITFGSDC